MGQRMGAQPVLHQPVVAVADARHQRGERRLQHRFMDQQIGPFVKICERGKCAVSPENATERRGVVKRSANVSINGGCSLRSASTVSPSRVKKPPGVDCAQRHQTAQVRPALVSNAKLDVGLHGDKERIPVLA